jgi:hypothetical protein
MHTLIVVKTKGGFASDHAFYPLLQRGDLMSPSTIPNITPTISVTIEQSVSLLLASIALEELALVHIMNAEAEKLQFVVGTLGVTPEVVPTISDILAVNNSVRRTLQDVIKKEMLLQFKLENLVSIIPSTSTSLSNEYD